MKREGQRRATPIALGVVIIVIVIVIIELTCCSWLFVLKMRGNLCLLCAPSLCVIV